MLNEGIHVDDVDAVVLCRPTVSPILYKQQIGRAMAAGSVKRGVNCETIHPVIFDLVNNFDSLYQIDALRDCRELMEQIQRNLDATWDIYYQELRRYAKEKGTPKMPKRYVTEDGLYLGRWIQRQKALYNEGKLSEARVRRMEALGVAWDSGFDQQFEHWLGLLWRYREEHGDAAVPVGYETAEGEKLGSWVAQQRKIRRGTIRHSVVLDGEKIGMLDALGMDWGRGKQAGDAQK